jgi:hypothetical protein
VAFDVSTAGNNNNQQIQNSFARLIERINADDHSIRKLSFGKLRKTSANLVRRCSNGEIAAVQLCHGRAVRQDDLADVYSNRPFGRLFLALREVERRLAPVFAAAGPDPFLSQPQAYTSRNMIEQIKEMRGDGMKIRDIAETVGMSVSAISTHLNRNRRPKPR